MWKSYSVGSASKGLTLIEVVASIALLSTLAVVLLSAHAKHVRQVTQSHQKSLAIDLADQLMADWFSNSDPFPRNQAGRFAEFPDMFWQTTSQRYVSHRDWPCERVTLQLFLTNSSEPLLSLQVIDSPLPQDRVSNEVR